MTRNQRIGLIVAAVGVAVLAFVIASSGDDDSDTAAQTNATTQTDTGNNGGGTPTETDAPAAPEPEITRIQIRGGEVVGGSAEIKVKKGDTVAIVVRADAPDELHLHGFDIEKKVAPGQPARFLFKADLEGQVDLESHNAEDAGREPGVATLIVEPR